MKLRLICVIYSILIFLHSAVQPSSSFTPTGKQQSSASATKTTMSTLEKQAKGQIVGWWYKMKVVLNDYSTEVVDTSTLSSSSRAPNELVKEIRKKMLNIKSER